MTSDAKVTIREVAKLAGVHPATVSRALNAETRGLVNEATAKRVEMAAWKLRYRPNPSARSLKTRRSDTIGIIVPDLANPLFPPIVRGIEDALAPAGYIPLVGNSDNDADRERLVLDRMQSRRVDGFILATSSRNHVLPDHVDGVDVPVVLVNRVTADVGVPSVSVDNAAGIRMAVRHLFELGHRRIGHLAGPQELSTGFGRYAGYLSAMAEYGLAIDPAFVAFADYFSEADGYLRASQIMAEAIEGRPTAIVAANDSLALGALRAFEDAGLSCPAEISLVGFNDMAFMDRVQPPLTTIRVPQYELGTEAARLMLERLSDDGSTAAKSVLLFPELVVRASTAALSTAAEISPAAAPSSRRRAAGDGG